MSAPRPYDLNDAAELARLHDELEGYMRVSLKDGTDTDGRAHAYAALVQLNQLNKKSWYLKMAKLEDGQEIGAGLVARDPSF